MEKESEHPVPDLVLMQHKIDVVNKQITFNASDLLTNF